jgi:two-component system response regulator YesN
LEGGIEILIHALKQHTTHLLDFLRKKKMFWRILLLYLAGSVLLLAVFSAVTTQLLTRYATNDAIARNRDALAQAYAAADYVLNTTYDTYYKLYQSFEASELMFSSGATVEDTLAVGALFHRLGSFSDCVDSIYLINHSSERVYDSSGGIYSPDDFYDTQAMRLFQFYNENSNTLFLPRTVDFASEHGDSQRYYISLIFSRRNAVMIPMGGMIVNIDETKLINLITRELKTPEDIYVVSENGSILANTDTSLINTSIYGSPLWEQIALYENQMDFSFYADFKGQRCLVTGRNAPRLRFYFLRVTPVAQLQQSVSYIRNVVLICSAVFLLLALIMSMVASRFIYRPISHLVTNLRLPPVSGEREASPTPPLDEFSFLNNAYQMLIDEVESLSHDNILLARAQKREVLTRLFYGEYPTEQKCYEEAARQGIASQTGVYLALVLLFDDFKSFSRDRSAQDIALLRYALSNIAEELLSAHCPAYSAEIGADQVAVLLQMAQPTDTAPLWLKEALNKINDAMREHLHCGISCGIGPPVQTLTELVTSYNCAMTASGYRLVLGCGSIIPYEEISMRQGIALEYPTETDAAIVQALRNRSEEKACRELDHFFSSFAFANVDIINMTITQLTISLSRTAHGMVGGHEGTRQLPNYRVLSVMLTSCDTLEQKKNTLTDYCLQVIRIRNSEVQTKRENLVERIREFIETNYDNPMLNTEDIAAFAELSPNYLRTVFKNAIGKSPIDYLTDYRIERAKELLTETDTSTKEIAATVGYYNHRYFYSVFKAKTGLTATAYRTAQRSVQPDTKKGGQDEKS